MYSNRRPGRGAGREDRGQRGGYARAAPGPGDWKFGTVYALRDTFGFLRPTHRADDVYFSLRDAPRDVQQGDFVYYLEVEGAKGPAARELNHLPFHEQTVTASNVKAVVKVDASNPSRKGNAGMLTIQDPNSSLDGYDVPFIAEEVVNTRRGIFQGDLVECDVAEIPRLGYLRAQNVRLLQSARDIRRAKEVQEMLEAGMPRIQGAVDSLKGDYGFINCVDRKGRVYFRVEDVHVPTEDQSASAESGQASGNNNQLKAGTEVEFFIISEAGKDGLRNRAIYIDILPPGTVQFEIIVRRDVVGVVTQLPHGSGAQQRPGLAAVNLAHYPDVPDMPQNVELWALVMETTKSLQQGDVLEFDVAKYLPESIYFARNVRVKEFAPLLREYGVITRLKDGSFGFIRSAMRETDLYFRFEDLLQPDGRPMARDDIVENMCVSYDYTIAVDDRARKQPNKQDVIRWRAFRIVPCDPELCRDYLVLQRNFRGVVLKDAQKQNQTGTIRLTAHPSAEPSSEGQSNDWRSDDLGEIEIPPEVEFRDIEDLLQRFMRQTQEKAIALPELSNVYKRAIAQLCDKHKLGYESHTTTALGGVPITAMKIWKFDNAEEFATWALTKPPIILNRKDRKIELLPFTRAHTDERLGVVGHGTEVTFSLCLDRRTLARFAGEVTLTDAPVSDGEVRRLGVVDTVRSKGKPNMHGFIRELEQQEKLNFNAQEFQDADAAAQVAVGTVVSFAIRNRGGFRTAVSISVEEPLSGKEEELPGQCVAVIVEQKAESEDAPASLAAVLVDTSAEPALARVYLELQPGMPNPELEHTLPSQHAGEPPFRFFPLLPRTPLPLADGADVAAGDLVRCAAIVKRGLSPVPVRVRVIGRVEGSTARCPKVEGVISRLEPAIGEVAVDAKLLGEPAEESKSVSAFGNAVTFAFDPRQLPAAATAAAAAAASAEGAPNEKAARPELGDTLECIVVPSLKVALPLAFQKAQRRERPRLVVNEGLKAKAKLKTGVVMAKGPDGTGGFVPGWRPTPNVSQMPWANLFSHLQEL